MKIRNIDKKGFEILETVGSQRHQEESPLKYFSSLLYARL